MDGADKDQTESDWAAFRKALLRQRGHVALPKDGGSPAHITTGDRRRGGSSGGGGAASATSTPPPPGRSPAPPAPGRAVRILELHPDDSDDEASSDSEVDDVASALLDSTASPDKGSAASVWAQLSTEELNDMLVGSDADIGSFDPQKLVPLLRTPHRRVRFLRGVLGSEFAARGYEKRRFARSGPLPGRVGDLNISAKLALVRGLQMHVGLSHRSARAGIVCIFMCTRGEELAALKAGLPSLYEVVYRGLSRSARDTVLAHFNAEAAHMGGAGRDIAVVCDAEDTLFANGNDTSYPTGTRYPGAAAFFNALCSAHTASGSWSTVLFVSSRPRLGREAARQARAVLTADEVVLLESPGEPAAEKSRKFDQFVLYASLFPEKKYVWVGNSDSGNLALARMMLSASTRLMDTSLRCFVHDVRLEGDVGAVTAHTERQALREQGIYVFDSYVTAAAAAHELGLINKHEVFNVADAAEREFETISFRSSDQQRSRRDEIAQARRDDLTPGGGVRRSGGSGDGAHGTPHSRRSGGAPSGSRSGGSRSHSPPGHVPRPVGGYSSVLTFGDAAATATPSPQTSASGRPPRDQKRLSPAPREDTSSPGAASHLSRDRTRPAVELHVEVAPDSYQTLHVGEEEDAMVAARAFCHRQGLNVASAPPLAELVEFKRANRRRSPSAYSTRSHGEGTPLVVSHDTLKSSAIRAEAVAAEAATAVGVWDERVAAAESQERLDAAYRTHEELRRKIVDLEAELSMQRESRRAEAESHEVTLKARDGELESLKHRIDHLAGLLAGKELEVGESARKTEDVVNAAKSAADEARARYDEAQSRLAHVARERDSALAKAQEAAADAAAAREAAAALSDARRTAERAGQQLQDENAALKDALARHERIEAETRKERRAALGSVWEAEAAVLAMLGRGEDEAEFTGSEDLLALLERHNSTVSSLVVWREETLTEITETRRVLTQTLSERDSAVRERDSVRSELSQARRGASESDEHFTRTLSRVRTELEQRVSAAEAAEQRAQNAAAAARRELEALEDERDRALSARDAALAAKAAADGERVDAVAALRKEVAELKEARERALSSAESAQSELSASLQARERDLATALDERDEARRSLATCERSLSSVKSDRDTAQATVDGLSSRMKQLERDIEDALAGKRAAERAHAAALEDVSDARAAQSMLERERDAARDEERNAAAARDEAIAARDEALSNASEALAEREREMLARRNADNKAAIAQSEASDARAEADSARRAAAEAEQRARAAEAARDAAQRAERAAEQRAADADRAAKSANSGRDEAASAVARAEAERDRAISARQHSESERESALSELERMRAMLSSATAAARQRDQELRDAQRRAEEAEGAARRAQRTAEAAQHELERANNERDNALAQARQADVDREEAERACNEAGNALRAAEEARDAAIQAADSASRHSSRFEMLSREAAAERDDLRRQLEELQRRLADTEAKLADTESELEAAREQALEDIRRNVAAVRSAFEEQLVSLRSERDGLADQVGDLNERLMELDSAYSTAEQSLQATSKMAAAAEAARTRAADRSAASDARLRDLESRLTAAEREAASMRAAMEAARADANALRREKMSLEVRAGSLEGKCTELEATVTVLRKAATQTHFGVSETMADDSALAALYHQTDATPAAGDRYEYSSRAGSVRSVRTHESRSSTRVATRTISLTSTSASNGATHTHTSHARGVADDAE